MIKKSLKWNLKLMMSRGHLMVQLWTD